MHSNWWVLICLVFHSPQLVANVVIVVKRSKERNHWSDFEVQC